MGYILGIDQGGTKTDAIIIDKEGIIMSIGKYKGANYAYDGIDAAMGAINESAQMSFAAAGLGLADLDKIAVSMTGADWPHEYEFLEAELTKLFSANNVAVYNDCIGAMRAGGVSLPCGIICVGTGTNIAVRSNNGEIVYGYFVENRYQGAAALGFAAYEAIMRAHIGTGGETSLSGPITEGRAKDPEDLLKKITMNEISINYDDFLPIVYNEALKGDRVSVCIIEQFANGLCAYIFAGAAKLGIDINNFTLVLSGGVFKGQGRLLANEVKKCFAAYPGFKIVNARYEPVVGSALLGLESFYDFNIPDMIMANIEHGCKKFNLLREKG